ncbi:MAG: rod shape-determining protein MreC [Candidatus Moduliflexus flocculans]|nr:rod shape-determining protein MreC [Candidatus Moduliflexus flocculans]
MPFWEKRRSALVLAGLTVFHILLISVQVPRGPRSRSSSGRSSSSSRPSRGPATGLVRGAGSLWNGYFDLRGVRAENAEAQAGGLLPQPGRPLPRGPAAPSRAPRRSSGAAWPAFRARVVVARTIGVDSANPHQSVVIDKGSLDGIGREHGRLRPVRAPRRPDDRAGQPERGHGPARHRQGQQRLASSRPSTGLTGSMTGLSRPVCELRYVLASATGRRAGRGAADDRLRQDLPGRHPRRHHPEPGAGRGLAGLPAHHWSRPTSASTPSTSSPC